MRWSLLRPVCYGSFRAASNVLVLPSVVHSSVSHNFWAWCCLWRILLKISSSWIFRIALVFSVESWLVLVARCCCWQTWWIPFSIPGREYWVALQLLELTTQPGDPVDIIDILQHRKIKDLGIGRVRTTYTRWGNAGPKVNDTLNYNNIDHKLTWPVPLPLGWGFCRCCSFRKSIYICYIFTKYQVFTPFTYLQNTKGVIMPGLSIQDFCRTILCQETC